MARRPARSPTGRHLEVGSDLLFYEGLHGCAVTPEVEHRKAGRHSPRRGSGGEPRVDPEDPPRPRHARLLDRSRGGHDPAPHAGLRELHLPAVLRDAHQFPARADGGYVESRSSRSGFPTAEESMVVVRFANPRGIDFPYLLSMICGSHDVARELPRGARWQARPRHATDPHAAHPAAPGEKEARSMSPP